jgi:hypothetical protein
VLFPERIAAWWFPALRAGCLCSSATEFTHDAQIADNFVLCAAYSVRLAVRFVVKACRRKIREALVPQEKLEEAGEE